MYVTTTSKGKYCLKSAQERMTRRKPIARTKDSDMMVFRPAVILYAVLKGMKMNLRERLRTSGGKWAADDALS